MRALVVLLYAILTLNIAAGLAGAVALPDGRPAVRATGAALRPRPRDEEATVAERVFGDIWP